MVITMQKAVDSAIAYLSREAVKIQSMQSRFLVYAALGAAKSNPGSILAPMVDRLKLFGIVSQDGSLDTATLRSALDTAFASVPTFQFLGFTFSQADAVELLNLMEA